MVIDLIKIICFDENFQEIFIEELFLYFIIICNKIIIFNNIFNILIDVVTSRNYEHTIIYFLL